MTPIPLTVLAYEGPGVRAYLGMMRRFRLRPERIVLMVQSRHPATKKPVGRWLPYRGRLWYAQRVQEYAQNYWPRRIKASHPHLVEAVVKGLGPTCDQAEGLVAEMLGRFRYEDYADELERVLVKDLRDPALAETLSRIGAGTVLFTGGGIVPVSLLELPGVRFLHVHPGYLPEVRGADGLLWSTLVRGRPAMSCFYLSRGIDTGQVIAAEDYPALCFDISARPRPDDQTLYRAIFSFYDPILRAEFLVRRVLKPAPDLSRLSAAGQDLSRGVTYHFMHPGLRRGVLERIFESGQPA